MDPNEEERLMNEELLLLKLRSLELKASHNASASISRLPNEMLVAIFMKLKDTYFIPLRHWHQITHVCRHWRRVALEAACLWTKPPTHLHEYTLLMLERSRTSSLCIDLRQTASTATSAAVLDHVRRIGSLSIQQRIEDLDKLQALLSTLKHAESHLIHLDISQYPDLKFKPQEARFRLAPGTLQNLTSLTSLNLRSTSVDWQIFPIITLTTLSLRYTTASDGLSWEQLGAAFSEMILLAKLAIDLTSLQLRSPRMLTMHLPQLRYLDISKSVSSELHCFLRYAKFPSLQQAYMVCSTDEDDDYVNTNSIPLALLEGGNFGRPDWLLLENERVSFTWTPWTRSLSFEPELVLYLTTNAPMIKDFVTRLPPKIALGITHLRLHIQLSELEDVSTIFKGLPSVRLLQACWSKSLIRNLKIPLNHSSETSIPLASLTSIELDGYVTQGDPVSNLLDDFRHCLQSRREHGAGIKYLFVEWLETLQQFHLLDKVVEELRVKEIFDAEHEGSV